LPIDLHFEWQPAGLEELVSPDQVPKRTNAPTPCYGHICRTVSFPNAPDEGEAARAWLRLAQYQATQIGRAPFFVQPFEEDLPGHLLCAINSVQPAPNQPYPWINRRKPLKLDEIDAGHLMLDDMGCIYISIDESGQLHAIAESY
jgi:hypothetical protein